MAIAILCLCGKHYSVNDRLAGTSMRCPSCKRIVRVPRETAAAAAAAGGAEREVDFDSLDFGAYEVSGDDADDDDASHAPSTSTSLTGHAGTSRGGTKPTFAPFTAFDRAGGTQASNPGNLRIDPLMCLRHPWLLGQFVVLTVAGVLLGLLVKPILFALCAAAVYVLLSDLNSIAGRCRSGDVNAGVVLSTRPYLVATITDLGTGGRAYPAIKVMRAPLGGMTGGPPRVGMRVTTASYYAPDVAGRGYWADIDPVVTETVTRNTADIARLKRSIPDAQWRALEEIAPTLPAKFALYYLWEPDWLAKAARMRRKNSRGLVYVAILAGAIGLVIYGNRRSRMADMDKPIPAAVYHGPTRPPSPGPAAPARPSPAERAGTAVARSGIEPAAPDPEKTVADVEAEAAPAEMSEDDDVADSGADSEVEAEVEEAAESAVVPPPAVFKAGQVVEVKWGSQWYPSRILKREGRKYLIHYDGWGDHFDEWVRADRIRVR